MLPVLENGNLYNPSTAKLVLDLGNEDHAEYKL